MNSQNRTSQQNFTPPSEQEIALRAHQIWLESGCPHGHDVDNWITAERQLTKDSLEKVRDPLTQDRMKPSKGMNRDPRQTDLTPVTEDVPYVAFDSEAPLATKVAEQVIDPTEPASRRSKTSLEIDTP
jgi:hypothetical protein